MDRKKQIYQDTDSAKENKYHSSSLKISVITDKIPLQ